MPMLQLILLALIQGITEFLPISSSGHLILLPNLTGMADQGQAIDVAVHVGTLAAVVLYFWRDVRVAALGTVDLIRGRRETPGARLAFGLIIATIPLQLITKHRAMVPNRPPPRTRALHPPRPQRHH